MAAPEPPTPQLSMLKPGLDGLPEVLLPEGYRLSTFRPGYGDHWRRIMADSFGQDPEKYQFDRMMRSDPAFRPERVFFIVFGDTPVATASAWYLPDVMPDAGTVHYLGVVRRHQGKKLGYWVSLAALRRMAAEGRKRARLLTDDFRLPAIKTYLNLGFEPLLVHEGHRERWAAVFDELKLPELKERFQHILESPLWQKPARHSDDFDYAARLHRRRRWLAGRPPGRIVKGEIDSFADESLYEPAALGTAGASIREVAAGENRPFELWFRAGPAGLPAGAEVLFYTPCQRPLGERVQTDDPEEPGFVELTGPDGVEPLAEPGFRVGRDLSAGREVRLTIGRKAGFRWTPLAGRKEFKVIVDVGKGEPMMRLPEPVVVRVLPSDADHIDVFLPGTAPPKTGVVATVTIRDEFDNRVPYHGCLSVGGWADGYPAHLSDGLGSVYFPFLAPFTVTEVASGPCSDVRSNWCLPSDGPQLYFGDLHAHDLNSQAEGYTADVYRWAIEDKRLDFLAVPVQVHSYLDNDKWLAAKLLNETFLDEGRFVTFLSFEWQHSHYGDKVIHYLGGDMPYLPVDDERYATPAGLYEALRGAGALVISHHPGYALGLHVPGTDWDAMETDVDRLVEIWSMHGSSEGYSPRDRPLQPPRREAGVMEGLRKGLRFGLVAGSDTHSGRPGGSAKEPRAYWGGLCAIWAEELTRRSLFEALRARRTYALTGARIALKFSVNGAPMGSEIPAADSRRLVAEVWAPNVVTQIQLLRNGEVLREEAPNTDICRVEFEDIHAKPAFYHCRVRQADGHLAVCSPVWVG